MISHSATCRTYSESFAFLIVRLSPNICPQAARTSCKHGFWLLVPIYPACSYAQVRPRIARWLTGSSVFYEKKKRVSHSWYSFSFHETSGIRNNRLIKKYWNERIFQHPFYNSTLNSTPIYIIQSVNPFTVRNCFSSWGLLAVFYWSKIPNNMAWLVQVLLLEQVLITFIPYI